MKKIVSTIEGYTCFIEKNKKNVECTIYETGIPMQSCDIARVLNISPSAVSQSLKRSIKKIFDYIKKRNKELTTIEIICYMALMFDLKCQNEYIKFFNLFPNDIKGEAYESARETGLRPYQIMC